MSRSTTTDAELIAALVALEKSAPKLVKSSVYPAPAEPTTLVRSWKMNEFKYYDIPSPFPTYARGLFTLGDRIVVRGYDKFFNTGEVPWTEVCDSFVTLLTLFSLNLFQSGLFSSLILALLIFSLSNQTDASSSSPHSLHPSSSLRQNTPLVVSQDKAKPTP